MNRRILKVTGMVLFLVLATGVIPLCMANPTTEALHRDALLDCKAGRFNAAIPKLESVIKQDPTAIGCYSDLGCCYLTRRNYTKALTCFKKVLASEPDDLTTLANLGYTYLAMNNLDNAKSIYIKITNLDPSNAKARTQLATIYMRERNFDGAIQEVKRLIDQEPENLSFRKTLIKLYLQKGEREKARDLCKKALAINPHDSELNSISQNLELAGNPSTHAPAASPPETGKSRAPGLDVLLFAAIALSLLVAGAIILSIMLKKWTTSYSFFPQSVPLMTGTPGAEEQKERDSDLPGADEEEQQSPPEDQTLREGPPLE
jgi:tetratricopeptide (TPR) repeat protein